ncbi:adenine phosphoribosyltransferase [Pyruvatibacter sp.]|uniref:adenine phosphoribosyltransferase n=1 Tax=Pyruvatibacter sp. TaxID=1981328 RepID=UPI0032675D0D
MQSDPMDIKDLIRTIPDYPKPGIMFRDITTLLNDARGFRCTIDQLVQLNVVAKIDIVAGIEARGFILGGAVAHQLGKPFVPIRKKGKLPGETIGVEYALEYGTDTVEMHIDAVTDGQCVLVVDDLIATGGTAEAAIKLVRQAGGKVIAASFVIDLPDIGGRKKLEDMGVEVQTLCEFEGD